MTSVECTCGHGSIDHFDEIGWCSSYSWAGKPCDCKRFVMPCCFGNQYHSPHCESRDSSVQRIEEKP